MKYEINDTVVLTPGARRGVLKNVQGCDLKGQEELLETYLRLSGTRRPHVFISHSASDFAPLAKVVHEGRGDLRLLLFDETVRPSQREFLAALFRSILTPEVAKFSSFDELPEILSSSERRDLFLGGVVDTIDRIIVLYRGTVDRMIVPFSWFITKPGGVKPDFDDFAVVDHGQTIRLGSYEAATDAILYDFDRDYRRRAKQRELKQDESFGASLRRLRLLRGLSRDDFSDISPKTIARIERGEVDTPRERTLQQIADRLGVNAEDIASY